MDSSSPGRGSVAVLAVVLLLAVGTLGATGVAAAQASTIYVDTGAGDDDCTGDDYDSIQNAVDSATAGDTVVICDGSYAEEVTVDKQLTLTARDDVILEGGGTRSVGLNVTAAADGTVVRGLVVRNFTDVGVELTATGSATLSNVSVQNTTVSNSSVGLATRPRDDATVSEVTVNHSVFAGNGLGVTFNSTDSATLSDVTFNESQVNDTAVTGLAVRAGGTAGSTASIRDVTVRRVLVNESSGASGPGFALAVAASNQTSIENVTVSRSVVRDNLRGVGVIAQDGALVRDVSVYRNRINRSDDDGVSFIETSTRPLESIDVRQNLVANADAGVSVSPDTDPAGIRVTRNFLRGNDQFGVENRNTSGTYLTAWLNHWGDDSGPGNASGSVSDPVTGTSADGTGDNVSANVNFDPWIGKGACTDAQLRSAVPDRSIEFYNETVGLSELQPTCVWERAPLPLRADDDDAATSVRNLQVFVRGESTADVPINRPRLSIYQQDESLTLRFESTTAADVSRFADSDTQLLVVRGEEASTDFEVGFDNSTGEGKLRVDAASVSLVDTPALDGNGELNQTFTPTSPGDYTFILVTNDFGPGVEVDDSGEIRVDGGISVVGVESIPVQNANASASTTEPSYPAGSNVTFLLDSNLQDARTNHGVILYNESTFADQRVTIEVDGNLSEALSGNLSSSEVTIERSIRSVNGFIRADVELSAFGFDVGPVDRSGRVDVGPFLDVATSEFGVEGVSDTVTSDAIILNGSIAVVSSDDSDTTVDVETFANFSTGTYRFLYLAEQGSDVSSDTGTVDLTTPTPTPTPTLPPGVTPTPTPTAAPGGGGGGGGGGQPGPGPGGEVEIEAATLLNESVRTGQPVVVRVDLANRDPARGRITLTLTADGETVTERTVSVGASSERTVFVRNRFGTAGTYAMGLNGQDLGTVTVTAATETPGETPTRSPTEGVTPTETEEITPTETEEITPTGTASPTPTLPRGPDAPTGTEVVITFVLVLALLAAVGVVVYVLPAGAV